MLFVPDHFYNFLPIDLVNLQILLLFPTNHLVLVCIRQTYPACLVHRLYFFEPKFQYPKEDLLQNYKVLFLICTEGCASPKNIERCAQARKFCGAKLSVRQKKAAPGKFRAVFLFGLVHCFCCCFYQAWEIPGLGFAVVEAVKLVVAF